MRQRDLHVRWAGHLPKPCFSGGDEGQPRLVIRILGDRFVGQALVRAGAPVKNVRRLYEPPRGIRGRTLRGGRRPAERPRCRPRPWLRGSHTAPAPSPSALSTSTEPEPGTGRRPRRELSFDHANRVHSWRSPRRLFLRAALGKRRFRPVCPCPKPGSEVPPAPPASAPGLRRARPTRRVPSILSRNSSMRLRSSGDSSLTTQR